MKRYVVLAALLMSVFLLSACGGAEEEAPVETPETVAETEVLEEEAERESDTPGYYYGQIGENPIALQAVPNGFLLHYGQAGEVKTIELAMDGTDEEQESKLINITFSEAVETVMDYLFGSEEDDPE